MDELTPAGVLRLLLVEPDARTRVLLADALAQEGCEPHTVAALEEAFSRTDDIAFALVLVDLSDNDDPRRLVAAQALQRQIYPTPVALLLSRAAFLEEAEPPGFAFVLPVPVDQTDLFTLIALTLAEPLSAAQDPDVLIVERYYGALSAGDWDGLMDLCTDDITYTLIGDPPFSQTIAGKAAFRTYTEQTFQAFRGVAFTEILTYPAAHGLAARYTARWAGPDGAQQQSGVVFFLFEGEHIAHVRVHLNTSRLLGLSNT